MKENEKFDERPIKIGEELPRDWVVIVQSQNAWAKGYSLPNALKKLIKYDHGVRINKSSLCGDKEGYMGIMIYICSDPSAYVDNFGSICHCSGSCLINLGTTKSKCQFVSVSDFIRAK